MDVTEDTAERRWRRALGIAFGLGSQVLFLVTVWYLFWFLHDGGRRSSASLAALAIDALLAIQFAVPHSMLLLPRTRKFITRYLPGAFYGCLNCTVTCLCLLVVFAWWRSSPVVLWQAEGTAAAAVRAGFYASWAALFYSLYISGLGYQTGLTPWWYWFRRRPAPRRAFVEHGAYRWLRHPIYLSFLGLIWFAPRMTLDHAVLTGIWTAYIFVGSYLKDGRLTYYLGDVYRDYSSRVSGYPLVGFGPFGRRPWAATPTAATPAPADNASSAQHAA